MRSPDATDVERIEGLLRGMPPETAREAHLEGMIRELRSVSPRASHELRERVRTLREPERAALARLAAGARRSFRSRWRSPARSFSAATTTPRGPAR